MATDAAGTGQRPALQNRGSTTHLPPWRFHFEGLSDNNRGGVDSPSGASHARCAPRISTLRSGACPAANIDSGGTRHHDDAGFAATRKASVRSTVIVELDFFSKIVRPCLGHILTGRLVWELLRILACGGPPIFAESSLPLRPRPTKGNQPFLAVE
ncbi:uncharacterized protein LOC144099715 isoform X2 [Amblyomma americanum]